MNRKITLLILFVITGSISHSQTNKSGKPKLIIGIVVDQMRFDHLYRYTEKYSESGFKRILKEGFNFKNAHYDFIPTVTAAGHASIYTGTTPSVHGIIGNSWHDANRDIEVGNVADTSETIVGSKKENKNGASPRKLLSTTISDQLRLASNFESKVISVSFKDRGAILAGGATANAAYWHDWQTSPGYFVSSSYYMDKLPGWVTDFNESGKSVKYLDFVWNTLYPIESYSESDADNNSHERTLRSKSSPTFPYDFSELKKTYRELGAEFQLLWVSPQGNTLLTDFAIEAIKHENLGKDDKTDLINISYSVPDVAGHTFGPQSVELEDIYLRLDRDIEYLLKFLDANVGKDDYVLFLTSDHGAIQVASYLDKHRLPTGIARINQYHDSLSHFLNKKYGENKWIRNFNGEQVYLNRDLIHKSGLQLRLFQQEVADFLIGLDGVRYALTGYQLQNTEFTIGSNAQIQKGYHPKRSGDVLLVFEPGYIQSGSTGIKISEIKGTTHGSGYAFDTHVPLIWKGWSITNGESVRKVSITDIASTLAMMLNLQLPSGNTGSPLKELLN